VLNAPALITRCFQSNNRSYLLVTYSYKVSNLPYLNLSESNLPCYKLYLTLLQTCNLPCYEQFVVNISYFRIYVDFSLDKSLFSGTMMVDGGTGQCRKPY
jgi:hypothetical protein